MEVASTIFRRIITGSLYVLFDKYGTKYQFGATPNAKYQDGSLALNDLLHFRRHHKLPTYIVCVDLVKAVDPINHALLTEILQKYGAPSKVQISNQETIHKSEGSTEN